MSRAGRLRLQPRNLLLKANLVAAADGKDSNSGPHYAGDRGFESPSSSSGAPHSAASACATCPSRSTNCCSELGNRSTCSSRSCRPSAVAWGSGSQSAAGWSKHMAANFGANRTRLTGQSFASPLPLFRDAIKKSQMSALFTRRTALGRRRQFAGGRARGRNR